MVFNFRKRISRLSRSRIGRKAEYYYEKRKQGNIAKEYNEAEEEKALGIQKASPRIRVGDTIISHNGTRYGVKELTKKHIITVSGLRIPRNKQSLFTVQENKPSKIRGLISTGKRLYKH